jgi:hypothetical protein
MISKELKILKSLYPFIESKAKLVTNKKIKIGIMHKLRYHENGQVYVATITLKDNNNPPYFLLEVHKHAFSKFSIMNLKHIISHELSHIPELEKPKLITRIDINGKPYKVYQNIDTHGKQFTRTCRKLNVKSSFTKSNLNKIKKFK